MTGDIIKSFLVGLGFDVDESSLSKFNKSITSATLKVAALATSIEATAATVSFGITKISESFEDLGYEYKILAPAINKAIILRQELFRAYNAAGVNLTRVVISAAKLNLSITKTKYALEAIYKSVGSRFFELLTRQSDIFRKRLYDNMPRIQEFLERFVKAVFIAFEAVLRLGQRLWEILSRVYDFFKMLHDETNGWSTAILAALAAWEFFVKGLLSTPLGRVITLVGILVSLLDDLKVWQEGTGRSLFNWSYAIPYLDAVKNQLMGILDILKQIATFHPVNAIKSIGSFLFGSLPKLPEGYDPEKYYNNLRSNQVTPSGIPYVDWMNHSRQFPSDINQKVQQQTNIHVTGTPDAAGVGKAVAGEQNNVNLQMSRNLRSITQ